MKMIIQLNLFENQEVDDLETVSQHPKQMN